MGNRSKQQETMQSYNKYGRIFNMENKQLWYVQGIFDKEDWEIFNMKYVNMSMIECHVSMNWELSVNDICLTKAILFCKRTNPDQMVEHLQTIGCGKYITEVRKMITIQEYTTCVRQVSEAINNTPNEFQYESPHGDNSFRYHAVMSTFPCDEVFDENMEDSQESVLRVYDDASLDDSFFNDDQYVPMSVDDLLRSANHLLSMPTLAPEIDDLLKGVDYKNLL